MLPEEVAEMIENGAPEAVADAFNTWMDMYIHDPEKFEAEVKTVLRHSGQKLAGQEPTYGESCRATLVAILRGEAFTGNVPAAAKK